MTQQTNIRQWLPTTSMMLVSLISYIDRNTLALLAPTILAETGLSGEPYGFIISAFSVAYMIGNPVWGVLLDRFGLRRGMLASVGFWTVASASHAFASGFFSFAAARALLGFGEGATFPGGLRTAVQTIPIASRSRAVALAYSGGSLGAIITPILVTPIAARWGWRGAFWFTGLVGVIWLLLWMVISRRLPPHSTPVISHAGHLRLRDARVWAFMAAYAFGGLPLAFVLYGAAIYLSQVRGLSQVQIGALLWIPPVGWEVGYFFWGWISDRFPKSTGSILALLAILSLFLAFAPAIESLPGFLFSLFFAMFAVAGFVILAIAYATSVFSTDHAGLIAGLGAGSWSALVALCMPVFGRLFDERKYDSAFQLAAAFPVVGYVLWSYLSRGRRRA